MSDCCKHKDPSPEAVSAAAVASAPMESGCCGPSEGGRAKFDYLLWGSVSAVALGLLYMLLFGSADHALGQYSLAVTDLLHSIWWGLLLGALMVGLLNRVPRAWVMNLVGQGGTLTGYLRATFAGLLLDLCAHGILMVAMKLYKRGVSTGQVMAFLIASPWNSFSLTLILIGLIGWSWTLLFIFLSFVVALISGVIFDGLIRRGQLPINPYQQQAALAPPEPEVSLRAYMAAADWRPRAMGGLLWEGLKESRVVIRWAFFGVVIAALVRAFVPLDIFQDYLGPTLLGLSITIVAATLLEVCSEGSAPIGADILNRAQAPGNGFAFLMTGVATDYTEIMSIKETSGSWKLALFLPLICVPQVILLGWLINQTV